MRRAVRVIWLLPLLALLAGCFAVPATAEGATSAVREFLTARADRDAKKVWAMLSPNAQKAISRDGVTAFLQSQTISWESIGTATATDDGLMRVPIRNLVIHGADYEQTWPEDRLTLVYDGKQWRVGWIEPLLAKAQASYEDRDYADQLDLGKIMAKIDPLHYRGYLEQFFAYWGLDRYREADMALISATGKALPCQLPDVYDATARFKLGINQPDDAIRFARQALDTAAPYAPATYSKAWQADTLVILGKAQWSKGNRTEAEAATQQAGELDPANGTLATFRWLMTHPPTPPVNAPTKP